MYEFHEIANIFPLISEQELENLSKDIKQNGLLNKIILFEGKILDGRNRLKACEIAKITPEFDIYKGDAPLNFVISLNLHRRHLNESQRGMIAAKLANMDVGGDGSNQYTKSNPANLPLSTISQSEAAKLLNISERTLRDAKVIINTSPEEVPNVESGKKTIHEVKNEKKIKKRKDEIEKIKDKIKTDNLIIANKYDVIVIDPPWNYGREYNSESSRVASPYPEMNFNELSNIKLPSKDNCILWLWTTHAFIWDAKKLMEIWGFEYKAILVWNKEKMGIGFWLRMQCEFCLLGIKGNPLWESKNIRDLINESRREHSRKPIEFYKLIEDNFTGKFIDYFSREKYSNKWDCYGAEKEKF